MTPTIGRIVHYTLTAEDAQKVNKRRQDAVESDFTEEGTGAVIHYGEPVPEYCVFPMIVTTVDRGIVGGQVFLNGNDTLWVYPVMEAEHPGDPGLWFWPPRV